LTPAPNGAREEVVGLAPVPADPLHESAVALLSHWSAPDEQQDSVRRQLLTHLAAHDDAMWRSCPVGHLTGSTLVVDATGTQALFTLHPKIGRWLQMGGHCEPGDPDLAATAFREAVEESGIEHLELLAGPVDLDIHALDCPQGHPNRHLDVRWLAVAPAGATARPSEESPDLRWFPLDDPPPDADESTLRLVRLARARSRAAT
jgi:8-oxo-dGTP pyrophosphatase MutT (NUDIX family)